MAKVKLTKQEKQELRKSFFPFYKGEEIFNAVAHIVGASFALVALVLMILKSSGDVVKIISSVIFGLSMLLLFTMSAIYHFLHKNRAKKVFRIFDQISIFLLIAGTYTPFCLIALNNLIGFVIFGIVWGVSILGIVFNAINMTNPVVKVLSQIAYIALGWCVVFAFVPILNALELAGFIWLVVGGLLYTGGLFFYVFARRVPYLHAIWHLCVMFGAMAHFVSVYFYVL